ncbi:MAG: DUF362 domain-containing protein [bacterium]
MAKKKISRRDFIKQSSLLGVGGLILPNITPVISHLPEAFSTSKVVIVTHPNATSGSTINQSIVQTMTDRAIKELTGITDLGGAYESLFPGIIASNIIALKINCLFGTMSTHPQVANTITNGLTQMFSGTYNSNNIIIYDNQDGLISARGYTINASASGVRCFGTDHSGVGYDTYTIPVGSTTSRLSKIITQFAQYLVNVPIMKDHSMSQISLSMKNHYGTVHNPGSLHANSCNPYIADVNKATAIKDKTKLIVIDALFGCYNGGPDHAPNFTYNGIIVSTDPVAIDCVGRDIINEQRVLHGLTQYDPDYIHTVGYELGNDNAANINIVKIDLGLASVSNWKDYKN